MKSEILNESRHKMERSFQHFKDNIAGLGGNSISFVSGIRVKYNGTSDPLDRIASVLLVGQGNVQIRPHDSAALKEIRLALEKQGLSANQMGKEDVLYVYPPRMDTGLKEKFVGEVKQFAEDARITIRNIRHDVKKSLQKVKKTEVMSEDDERRLEKDLTKLVDEFINQIDGLATKKIKAINS